MRVQYVPEKVELTLRDPEKRIVVENSDHGVVIHSAPHNFTRREKIRVIRYLAAEGFISDEFEDFATPDSRMPTPIAWGADPKLAISQPSGLRRVDRLM